MKVRDLPLKHYIGRMARNKYFSFVRYGDGEFKTLYRNRGRNGRSQEINPRLHAHMEKSLIECPKSGIYFGLQRGMLRTDESTHRVIEYLRRKQLNLKWVNGDVFHLASKSGQLFPLIRQMRRMRVVMVSPEFHKRIVNRIFKYQIFIRVPTTNAYGAYNRIANSIRAAYKQLGDDVVYSFSAGPAAEILIQDLFPEIKNSYLIDFGSLWDIFCGHRSRKYMSKEKYSSAKIHRNLGLRT